MESSLCEKPERHASRKLSDHLTFEGQKQKVHSLVDKVRYAAATKPDDESIKKFIKRKGGINACASRYAEYVRRPGKV
jgi:hypothetical protein